MEMLITARGSSVIVLRIIVVYGDWIQRCKAQARAVSSLLHRLSCPTWSPCKNVERTLAFLGCMSGYSSVI